MNKNFQQYITGGVSLGLSLGILSLLARWLTANTILSSPETLFKYGVIGSVGYSLMGVFAFILFSFFAGKIKRRFPTHETIGDTLNERLPKHSYRIIMTLLLITSFDSLFIQALGAGILLHLLFDFPATIGLLFFFIYCFFYAGIGGMRSLLRIEPIKIVIIFATIIIIPVFFFIQEGIHPIYKGIRLYHPYILFWENYETFLFISTAILVGFGQVISDRVTWQRTHIIQANKVQMSFILTGIIWTTVPLAIFSLLLISIFDKNFDTVYTLLFDFILNINPTFIVGLFILLCFSIITTTFGAELHATTVLLVKNIIREKKRFKNRDLLKLSYATAGVISIFLFVVTSISTPTLPELLFYFGQVYSALIIPMLFVVFGKRSLSKFFSYSIILGIIVGGIFVYIGLPLFGIWTSFITSGVVAMILYFANPQFNRT